MSTTIGSVVIPSSLVVRTVVTKPPERLGAKMVMSIDEIALVIVGTRSWRYLPTFRKISQIL